MCQKRRLAFRPTLQDKETGISAAKSSIPRLASALGPAKGESKGTGPLRVISQMSEVMWILQTCALSVFRTMWFSKLISKAQVLKVGVPDVGFEPFAP